MQSARYPKHRLILLAIPLLSFAMHFHVFRTELIGYHVWRQTQTQTVINNFYREDMNILNPRYNEQPDTDRIVRMEFPVMQWLFAWGHKLFGGDIAVSRILSFLLGIFSVLGMYQLLRTLFGNKLYAALGAWAFNWSPVFYYYTVNPLPDNLALCCGIWSLAFFFSYTRTNSRVAVFLSALFWGLATLAKLPFIIYGTVPFVYLLHLTFRKKNSGAAAIVALSFLGWMVPALLWYSWVIPGWEGNGIVKGIMDNTMTGVQALDILQHNLISTLPELLLNYGSVLFFITGLYFIATKGRLTEIKPAMLLALSAAVLAYFLFEMNMIGKVHDYYLFPFLPLLFIIVTFGLQGLLRGRNRWFSYLSVAALCILPVTAFLRADSRWDKNEPGFNKMYLERKDLLQRLVKEDEYVVAGNDDSHFILLYHLDRKGWTFRKDGLDGTQLAFYRSKGAKYLFTDAAVDQKEEVTAQLGEKLLDENGVRVYKLK